MNPNSLFIYSLLILVPITTAAQTGNKSKVSSTLNYEILESYKPYNEEDSIGLKILLKENLEELTEDDLIQLLISISNGNKLVIVTVYLTREAFEANNVRELQQNLLLSYKKQILSIDVGTHEHTIEWLQKYGRFSYKDGKIDSLPLALNVSSAIFK